MASQNTEIQHAVAEAIKNSPERLERIYSLIDLSLTELERAIKQGSPDIKMAALKAITPAINRALESQKTDETGKDELMAKMNELLAEVRGDK